MRPLTHPPDCGASLVSDNYALTTAHCVTKEETRHLYEWVLLGGGSVFWDENIDPAVQMQEFASKNSVFINDNWVGDDLNGYGKLGIHL